MEHNLSSLLVSESEIASEALASVLQDLVQIGKESGKVIAAPALLRLDRNTQILVYLLALRAAVTLKVAVKFEATTAEIAEAIGADAKSVGECASRLKKLYLARGAHGIYIPPEKYRFVIDQIQRAKTKIKS